MILIQPLEQSQAGVAVGVSVVVEELCDGSVLGLFKSKQPKLPAWSNRLIWEEIPVTESLFSIRTSSNIVNEGCEWRDNPECGGMGVAGSEETDTSQHAKVALKPVALFSSIFQEVAVTKVIHGSVVHDVNVVAGMNGDATTEIVEILLVLYFFSQKFIAQT